MRNKKEFNLVMIIISTVLAAMLVAIYLSFQLAKSEEAYDDQKPIFYVTATRLNGRSRPSKRGIIEARFDQGDALIGTGEWSDEHTWVEVYGGESGTVWCDVRYLTERLDDVVVYNRDYGKIKIRTKPINGRVIGYLKRGREVHLSQVLLGWGKCKTGWIDLAYVKEED